MKIFGYIILALLSGILAFLAICCCCVFMNTLTERDIQTKTEYCVVSSGIYDPVFSVSESRSTQKTGKLPSPVQLRINAKTNMRIDSLKIEQANIQKQLDNSLSDIRQETNNIINKTNGWIGFWVAMAALLGVGIPIFSQLLISKELRDDIEQLRSKNELNKVHKLIAQMRFGIDNKIIDANSGQNFAKYIWSEILTCDEKIVNDLLDKKLSTANRREIQGILVHLCELATEIKRRTFSKNTRDFDKAIDKLKLIFAQLDVDEVDRNKMQKDIAHLFNQLSSLV